MVKCILRIAKNCFRKFDNTHRFEHSGVFLPHYGCPLLLAEAAVTGNLFDLVLQLCESAGHILVMLVQCTQPEFVPQQGDSPQL